MLLGDWVVVLNRKDDFARLNRFKMNAQCFHHGLQVEIFADPLLEVFGFWRERAQSLPPLKNPGPKPITSSSSLPITFSSLPS